MTRAIAETGAVAGCLELEITENAIVDNLDSVNEELRCLHEFGIKLVIDDFGIGYSSLAYLKRLPFHKLKIDRSFVRDMVQEPSGHDGRRFVGARLLVVYPPGTWPRNR